MTEEKTIQQNADEFVTALVNTIGSGTEQEVVDKNRDDALDIIISTGTFFPFYRVECACFFVTTTCLTTCGDFWLIFRCFLAK